MKFVTPSYKRFKKSLPKYLGFRVTMLKSLTNFQKF